MKENSESVLRAAISKETAKLDDLNYKIKMILENPKLDSVKLLSELFEEITVVEMTVTSMTVFYKRTFVPSKEEEKK